MNEENQENKNVEAEQITQNYLVDPAELYSDRTDSENMVESMSLPDVANPLDSTGLDENDEIDVTKKQTKPSVLDTPKNETKELQDALEKLKQVLSGSYDPAIKNLYAVVSNLTQTKTAPTAFTDERVSFNNNKHFFFDESGKVSEKVDWA
jgi:hypothetical protein